MSLTGIVFIALALSADAFSVSVAVASCLKKEHLKNALLCALFFGGFQMLMPIAGWQLGALANTYVSKVDHWIAFALLFAIGTNMIVEALKKSGEGDCSKFENGLSLKMLFVLAIATSIDAFAVGISFGCLKTGVFFPALIIGLITALVSALGSCLGKKIAKYAKDKAEFLGGLILIFIGAKILVEHLTEG